MKTFDILLVGDQILDSLERHKLAYGLENSTAPFKISRYLPLTYSRNIYSASVYY